MRQLLDAGKAYYAFDTPQELDARRSAVPNFQYDASTRNDMLLKSCELVLTDSGGVQKEAFFFGKQCITLREQTEWVELVENGFNILTGSNKQKIIEAFATSRSRTADFSMDRIQI